MKAIITKVVCNADCPLNMRFFGVLPPKLEESHPPVRWDVCENDYQGMVEFTTSEIFEHKKYQPVEVESCDILTMLNVKQPETWYYQEA
jgi:hypothetical protein